MKLEVNLVLEKGVVEMKEVDDNGIVFERVVDLNDFLKNYVYAVKANEDSREFIYMPPGTIEYRKNTASNIYIVHTNLHREFYGLTGKYDYLLVCEFNVEGNILLKSSVYQTTGSFHKVLSAFVKIEEFNKSLQCKNVDDGLFKCLGFVRDVALFESGTKVKYNKIV